MGIFKSQLENTSTKLPHCAARDGGFHYEEYKVEQKDVSCVNKWATKKFLCWYCKVQPLPHSARIMEFELEKSGKLSYAVDVYYRCIKCGLQYIFGLPITKEDYDAVKSVATEVLYA